MEIITTHINSDFDSLASMVAAKRLYPNAALVFPGALEKPVREYLTQQFRNIYAFTKLRQVPLEKVRRLIVVDTRRPARLGGLRACLDNKHLSIHLFDHHPDQPGDLQGDRTYIKNVGATVTLFCMLFQKQGLNLSTDEATLMALGIYQDTGNFLHSTTTPEDMQAAAWLLRQGANLDVVRQFTVRELNAKQVGVLGELLKNTVSYCIGSVHVMVSKLTLPQYLDDFSVIVQRMMAMENINVLFALISMENRLYLIARSRIPEVNTGIIARAFGGGGHSSAASATIKDMTLFEAEERLVYLLHRNIRPKAIAGEIMSAPVIAITPDVTIDEANSLMTRYNVTVLPVAEKGGNPETGERPTHLLGMLSRQVAEKAIFHKLGTLPVSEYMTTEIATLPETGTLADIQKLIIENRQRLIPVTEQETILGVITRTDLLGLLINDPAHMPIDFLREDERPSVKRARNLGGVMTQVLPKESIALLRDIGEIAEEIGVNSYVAGGFVRDMLLRTANSDIDVVIEGDGIAFAKHYAAKRSASVRTHDKFATATVIFPDNTRVDVATARLEYYEYPAALPTVELSSIKLDLYRRDFTINAMAIHLNPERFGTLVDYFNSQNDLKERQIQVLHNLSFVEDPTRIFRAIRFEGRLDFRITRHSEKLIKNAVDIHLVDRFTEPRFFYELKLILSENNPMASLRRLAHFKLFSYIWPELKPNLKIDRRFEHLITQANRAISWFNLLYLPVQIEPWMVYLLAIFSRSKTGELTAFSQRFDIPERQRKKLIQQKKDVERIARDMLNRPFIKPSEIYWLLMDLDYEGLLYLMTIARKRYIQQAVSLFVTSLRETTPLINGHELKKMGYTPGPAYRTMLNHLIEAQLDGKVGTREQAVDFIRSTYSGKKE
ncbi:MAG: prohead protease [Desulfobulbus propionicus]|nr:MAG: prohead protease [Desulfobulbus propionicus]